MTLLQPRRLLKKLLERRKTPAEAATPARRAFNAEVDFPSTLFLSMSTSHICNFRCKMCHIWMNEDRKDGLTTEQRVEVIRQFAALKPEGTVFLPGGEVMLDPPQLYALAAACKEAGVQCGIVTNGSKVQDEATARRLVESGITSICVSLDSHVPAVHERMRGMPGCFPETIRALELLLEAKARFSPSVTVYTSCVLCELNIDLLEEYMQFCKRLGVDHADFQLLSATFDNQAEGRDVFFEKNFWHDRESKERAKATIAAVVARHSGENGILPKNEHDLDWVRRTIDDPGFETEEPVCGSHERNLMIDAEGNVSLCFFTSSILEEPFLGNVATSDLRTLWTGEKARADRRVMDQCRLNCGTLNCHRRLA